MVLCAATVLRAQVRIQSSLSMLFHTVVLLKLKL